MIGNWRIGAQHNDMQYNEMQQHTQHEQQCYNVCRNGTVHIRHQCRKTTVLSCHRCLINTGVEKMNNF